MESSIRQTTSTKTLVLAALAYVVPSFIIAFVWHLVVFADYYERLQIYRDDKLVPLGLLTILLQGLIFAGWYPVQRRAGSMVAEGLRFAGVAGALSWTYTTLAVAAKFPMTSIFDFVLIETAFTACQWLPAGLLIAWVYHRAAD